MLSVVATTAGGIAALVLIAQLIRVPARPGLRALARWAWSLVRAILGLLWSVVGLLWWITGLPWWTTAQLRRVPGLRWIPQPQWIRRLPGPEQLTLGQWRAIDAETVRAPVEAGSTNLQVLMVLVTVAVSLTLQEYLGGHDTYAHLFPPDGSRYWELRGYVWWSGWRAFGYVVIPMIVIACMPGQRIRDPHVLPRGFFRHLEIYLRMFMLIFPALVLASTTPAFRQTYPF